jgi:hypothetical protein
LQNLARPANLFVYDLVKGNKPGSPCQRERPVLIVT